MIDFKNLKKLTIGGVELKQLFINGIQVWKAASYTNQIPISTDQSGAVYNGKGWKANTRVDPSGDQTVSGCESTGFIPCKVGDVIRLKNVTMPKGNANCRIVFYKSDKTRINHAQCNSSWYVDTCFKGVLDSNNSYTKFTITSASCAEMTSGTAFIRITANHIDDNSIITINQEIKD